MNTNKNWHYETLTTTELLRIVDRSHPEVKALAERIENIIKLQQDALLFGAKTLKDDRDALSL